MTPATLRLAEGYVQVESLGLVPVKGLAEPIEVHEVTGAAPVRTRLEAAAARGLTRFVGRDAEIAQLRLALEHAREGRGQVAAIVGEPGVGKSRLVWELTRRHPPADGSSSRPARHPTAGRRATSQSACCCGATSSWEEHDTYEDIGARISARLSALGSTCSTPSPTRPRRICATARAFADRGISLRDAPRSRLGYAFKHALTQEVATDRISPIAARCPCTDLEAIKRLHSDRLRSTSTGSPPTPCAPSSRTRPSSTAARRGPRPWRALRA